MHWTTTLLPSCRLCDCRAGPDTSATPDPQKHCDEESVVSLHGAAAIVVTGKSKTTRPRQTGLRLAWAGLGWIGLDWTGLDWTGLGGPRGVAATETAAWYRGKQRHRPPSDHRSISHERHRT